MHSTLLATIVFTIVIVVVPQWVATYVNGRPDSKRKQKPGERSLDQNSVTLQNGTKASQRSNSHEG